MSGWFLTGKSALGTLSVMGYMREPRPPANITGWRSISSIKFSLVGVAKTTRQQNKMAAVESKVEYTLEGIGNEVWWTFGVLSTSLVGIFVLLIFRRSAEDNHVHPQQVFSEFFDVTIISDCYFSDCLIFKARHSGQNTNTLKRRQKRG